MTPELIKAMIWGIQDEAYEHAVRVCESLSKKLAEDGYKAESQGADFCVQLLKKVLDQPKPELLSKPFATEEQGC